MNFPTDRTYTNTHEWLLNSDGSATVGITDYAQDQLGDIVFVNLPEPGDEVVKGEAFTDVESVKAVSEMISPVSGTIVEVNEILFDEPARINEAPYDAWFIKVEPVTDTLDTMDASAYEAFCASEA